MDGAGSSYTVPCSQSNTGNNNIRVATRRLQTAKRRLARLEAEFEKDYGWKSSPAERNADAELREAAQEVARARRFLKLAKESGDARMDDDLSTESAANITATSGE